MVGVVFPNLDEWIANLEELETMARRRRQVCGVGLLATHLRRREPASFEFG